MALSKPASKDAGRDWVFTLNNPAIEGAVDCSAKANAEALWSRAQLAGVTFLALQLEKGVERQTPHFQGYAVFGCVKRPSSVRKLLPSAHWERRMGTHKQVAAACLCSDFCKMLLWSTGSCVRLQG